MEEVMSIKIAASDIIKSRTVCFSGHRPEKLPIGGDNGAEVIRVLKSILYKEILDSINNGFNCFITGLARGVDLWAGEIVLELKAENENVRLIAVSPYRSYGKNFDGEDKYSFGNIMLKADEFVCISEEYTKDCIRRRNQYMVDNSDKLIAVVSDYKSGTGSTIRYAQNQGIPVRIIGAEYLEKEIAKLSGGGCGAEVSSVT